LEAAVGGQADDTDEAGVASAPISENGESDCYANVFELEESYPPNE